MLQSPTNSSPKQKSNWRDKLWRQSNPLSGKYTPTHNSLLRTPKTSPRVPSLSNSPTLTPGSLKQRKTDNELFLTPLDVLDHDHKVNNLLDNQIGMVFGDWSIPPPPPRKKFGSHTNKLDLLPSKTVAGPRIKPYFTTSSRVESNINQETCFICKDVLETKLDSEKLVPLECGDCIHGECLHANVDILLEKSIKEGALSKFTSEEALESKVLPVCRGKCCLLEGISHPVKPIDRNIVSDLMADAILSVKLSTISTSVPKRKIFTPSPLVFGSENRVSRYFFKDNQLLRPKSTAGQSYSFNSDRYSLMTETMLEESEALFSCESLALLLEDTKNVFIKHMLNKYSNFSPLVLVSLGSLRLVDMLQVAFGEGDFSSLIVYLFSNFIMIETEGNLPKLLPLNGEYSITTPETSVIQFVTTEGKVPILKLNSETDAIIEKWGIALSDLLLILPTDVITSSIKISELLSESSSKANFLKRDLYQKCLISADPRISTVLIIEPREIWSERSDNFEEELLKLGVKSFAEPLTNLYDTQPISPLNIIKLQTENALPMSLTKKEPFDDEHFKTDSDSDLDSDFDLINEVMHKHRL